MAWIWTGLGLLEEQSGNEPMAKAKRSGFLTGMSGKLGDAVFRKMKDGTTVITKKPDFSNRQFSEDQLSHQDLVKLAAAYGKVASKEHPIYAQKAEGAKKKRLQRRICRLVPPAGGTQRPLRGPGTAGRGEGRCDGDPLKTPDPGRRRKYFGAGRCEIAVRSLLRIPTCERGENPGRSLGPARQCGAARVLSASRESILLGAKH
jgi:hypothetical protein